MSVDLLHALMAGVFLLVWLLVWQIIVRGDGTQSQHDPETLNGERSPQSRSLLGRSRTSRRSTHIS